MEIRKLKAEDYSELMQLLNYSFKGDKNSDYFLKGLPKMWVKSDEYMSKHLAVFDNGIMAAVIGIYPFDVTIADEKLKFATTGNVATHPDYRGKGYMQILLEKAMQELNDKNIDAARLGGLRSRYNRFGYENCGIIYRATLTLRNAESYFKENLTEEIDFVEVTNDNDDAIEFIRKLNNTERISVDRGNNRDLFATLCAWENKPYLALKNGKKTGYLCAKTNGCQIAEQNSVNDEDNLLILANWLKSNGLDKVIFDFRPWNVKFGKLANKYCEYIAITNPSKFKIINWQKVLYALLKLQAEIHPLLNGEVNVRIENYGNLTVGVYDGIIKVEKTNATPDICLDELSAARFFFGHLPYNYASEVPEDKAQFLCNILPLPLSWHDQDRV